MIDRPRSTLKLYFIFAVTRKTVAIYAIYSKASQYDETLN